MTTAITLKNKKAAALLDELLKELHIGLPRSPGSGAFSATSVTETSP